MAEKKISGWLKTTLELGPVILYFVVYSRIKDTEYVFFGQPYNGFIVTTALFIPLLLVCTLILWRLTGTLSKMQIMTAVLVVVFGGLSIWFNDERFFKMKPTMIYLLFGGVLAFGLWRGQSYLRMVMDEALPMREEGWMMLTKRMAALFIGLAIANEVIWRTMSTDTWVNFKTFGLPILMFGFFVMQSGLFQKYAIETDTD